MKELIQEELAKVAEQKHIRILYACEAGSRSSGFGSPDSDYDVRFVFCKSVNWYLSLREKYDTIETPLRNGLDLRGWDLRKVLQLLYKSEPLIFEWINSEQVYQAAPGFVEDLRAIQGQYFSPRIVLNHYLELARKHYQTIYQQDQVRLKTYFHLLHPLLAAMWTGLYKDVPPVPFFRLVPLIQDKLDVMEYVSELYRLKTSTSENQLVDPLPQLHEFVEIQLETLEAIRQTLTKTRPDIVPLDILIYRYLELTENPIDPDLIPPPLDPLLPPEEDEAPVEAILEAIEDPG